MDLAKVDAILEGKGSQPFDVMESLQDIQESEGYLSEESLVKVSETLGIPIIEVFRLANFYKSFSLKPRGRYLVTVCMGTACHVQGAPKIANEILSYLKVEPGDMTKDGLFTVETVNCIGACALAPVIIINGRFYPKMTSKKVRGLVDNLRSQKQESEMDYAKS